MSASTDKSVTDIPCSCGYLADSIRDPNRLVSFEPELKEYRFEHTSRMGAIVPMILYHCPNCGGVASESRRDMFFAVVTDAELKRLQSLIRALKTVQEIEHLLGAPDRDHTYPPFSPELAHYLVQPQTGDPETGPFRVLTYTRLSETAQVQFTVFSNNEVRGGISPKYIGPPGLTWDS
jgi:hypothetical protein